MQRVGVIGLGDMGMGMARNLHQAGFAVTGYDLRIPRESLPFTVDNIDLTCHESMTGAFGKVDAALSCLPYSLNGGVARAAHRAGVHYFDLTEDVPTTRAIIDLAKTSKRLMAPQCGHTARASGCFFG